MKEPVLTAKAVFDRAHEIATPEERRAYLEEACGDDAELRRKVEALLQAFDEAGSFLDKPAADLDWTSDHVPGPSLDPQTPPIAPAESVGSCIGSYKLLQPIGEGGMGVVFRAEQQQPVRRTVALKVIKAGMDTAQVIARFEQERQALALMDHPHIAKVLDAGTTQSGRPYFVMELVQGLPITRYCDDQRLTLRQRLELFVPVCQAIQHAHQKGIIHRDIKPSNVLVASYDGKPAPKVIDFGVAKAIGGKLTERTLFTGMGGIVGTLEYMSPEQAEFNALDIDTRSDVYSLGVLLYELLTGTTPLMRQRLPEVSLTELLRLIREEEPPRPSTRLSETKESLASLSVQRRMEAAALVKALRGEVDWIVMKALDKDRSRRYETANGLAQDIQRYLADEPVEAGPPSATYRLRKLAWRHRRGLATAATLVLLLLVGAVVSTVLALWAFRAEHLASQRLDEATSQKERAEKAEKEAKSEEAKAKQSEADTKAVLEYFQDKVLSAGRPKGQVGGLGREVKLIEAVEQAREKLADSFKDRPVVEASIRSTLGETYKFLGDYTQAMRQHERALALRESHLGPDHLDTIVSRYNLAHAYYTVGRLAEAIELNKKVLKQREALLGPEHLDTFRARGGLANVYDGAGRTAEAIDLYEQILKYHEAKYGLDHSNALRARSNLANAYYSAGRFADAIRLHEQDLKHQEAKLEPDHPDTLYTRESLSTAYHAAGRIVDAILLKEPTLRQMEVKLGPDHAYTLVCRHTLANAYLSADRTAEAIRLHEQNLKRMEARLGREHPFTLHSRYSLANAYLSAGRTAEAIRLHEKALQQREAKLGTDHPDTLTSRSSLADAYLDANRTSDAIHLYEQTLKQRETKLGSQHPSTLSSRNGLANAYRDVGRIAEAIALYEQTLKQRQNKLGTDHPDTLQSRSSLAGAYLEAGRTAESLRLAESVLERQKAKLGPEHVQVASTLSVLGGGLLQQKKYVDAELLLRDCLKIRETKQPDAWKAFATQALLGAALLGQKKYTDAEPLLLKGYQGMKQRAAKIPPTSKVHLTQALQRLVQLYEATGKQEEADQWRKQLEQYRQDHAKDAAKK